MKQNLLNALRGLPTGYAEFMDVALPDLPSPPADVDAANIVVGQLAQYLLDVFSAFAGLRPLLIPAHMGQRNEAVIGLLLASLEGSSLPFFLVPIFPAEGQCYEFSYDMGVYCTVIGDASQIETLFVNYHDESYAMSPTATPGRYGASIYIDIEIDPSVVATWEDALTLTATSVNPNTPPSSVDVHFQWTTDPAAEPIPFTGGEGGSSGGAGASGGW